jgi:hypothetical protein
LIADLIVDGTFRDAYDVARALSLRDDADVNAILIEIAVNRNRPRDHEREFLLRVVLEGLINRTLPSLEEISAANKASLDVLLEVLETFYSPSTRASILWLSRGLPNGPGSQTLLRTGERLYQEVEGMSGYLTSEHLHEYEAYLACGLQFPSTEFLAQVTRIVARSRQASVVNAGRAVLKQLL